MNDIAHNLAQVRDKISAAATRCGRSPEEITLLAVSKTKPASAIAEAIDAGQRQFGESANVMAMTMLWQDTFRVLCPREN